MQFADPTKLRGLLGPDVTLDASICNECNCNCDEDGSCTGPCSSNCKCYEYESPRSEVVTHYQTR